MTLDKQHCPHCHVGVLTQKRITTFPVVEGKTIMAPNLPLWKCDVCGWSKFRPEIAAWLDSMIMPGEKNLAGIKTQQGKAAPDGFWKVL